MTATHRPPRVAPRPRGDPRPQPSKSPAPSEPCCLLRPSWDLGEQPPSHGRCALTLTHSVPFPLLRLVEGLLGLGSFIQWEGQQQSFLPQARRRGLTLSKVPLFIAKAIRGNVLHLKLRDILVSSIRLWDTWPYM